MNIITKFTIPSILVATATADAPIAVSCEQDLYALCAYANCTQNENSETANCPCYSVQGSSLARIDLIHDDQIRQATIDKCTNVTSCIDNDAPICEAISDGSLWPGADAVSTFSRAFELENGVVLNESGERDKPNWECFGQKNRLVPNCMLAPCRILDVPSANPYFAGEAMMECTCALIEAEVEYPIFGGLQDPCGEALVNTAGPVLTSYAMDRNAVKKAWDAVAIEFGSGSEIGHTPLNPTESSAEKMLDNSGGTPYYAPLLAFVLLILNVFLH